jgi:UDP-N-acetylmuramoyl-L-alanyl-D-glutamate--2,6-diaminopimelate ligase
MKQRLRERVTKSLPAGLAARTLELYRRGRAKLISARYGNPAETVRVIAVAGPYGKTTTALLLSELLKEAGRTVALHLHTSSEEIDFASLLQKDLKAAKRDNAEFFILEATPELLASGALSGIVLDTVVITGENDVAAELLKQVVNYAVVPDDHHAGALAIAEHQIISFGEQETAEAKLDKLTLYRRGTEVKMTIDHHTELVVSTHLIGKANAYNLVAAVAAAYVLGVALDTVEEGSARLEEVTGNYEYGSGSQVYVLVKDRATEDRSIELAVESAKQLTKRRLIVALELQDDREEVVTKVKKLADRVILVRTGEATLPGIEVVESIEEGMLVAQRAAKKDDTVLLVGPQFVTNRLAPDTESTKKE